MNIKTEYVELSLISETVLMLKAFTKARNGSLHNQADSALRKGIAAHVADAPESFQANYRKYLAELQAE